MVFQSHLEFEMMINRRIHVLKGQHNLAQGFDVSSVERQRPGFGNRRKNRPRNNVHKREIHISDECDDLVFPEDVVLQFRPKEIICFAHRILADGFSSTSFTQGGVSDRSSRNFALSYDILALQAGKKFANASCITSWINT